MRVWFVLLFLFFTKAYNLWSQQNYRILHWGIESGLSQGINLKILKDHQGFLWATSFEGVNRFDGKTFRNFYSFPRKRNSIHGTETSGLVEDSLHKIWIGSGDGLNRYDPIEDSVSNFFADKQKEHSRGYIIPIAAKSNEVICFDITGTISAYNCKNFSRRIITRELKWYNDYSNTINSYLHLSKNELWIPASTGVCRVELETGKLEILLPDKSVSTVFLNEQTDQLIAGTNEGVIFTNLKSGEQQVVDSINDVRLGKITSIAKDRDGNLWIGTEEQGLFVLRPGHESIHLQKSNDQNSISGNKINAIYCDATGIVWVSASTNGIDQLIPGNRMMHYSANESMPNSLSNNVVRCFIEDNNKNIWVATQGGGINVLNPKTGKFSYLTRKKIPALPFDFIRYMVRDSNNVAWIGTERGMCKMDMSTHITQPIDFINSSGLQLGSPYIEQIVDYNNSEWLIATKEFGLFRLHKNSTTATQLKFPGNKHVFYAAVVNQLLFVSTWDNDPKIFRANGAEWEELHSEISKFTITYVIHDEAAKRYWVGTLKGLLEVDENLKIVKQYTRDDGLSNHYIYAILQDREDLLWISTNRGLTLFNPRSKTFRVFIPSDGLQGYEYNAKSAFMASDGNLYFGGTNGFDVIRTSSQTIDIEPAKFYVKEFLVNNVPYFGWSGDTMQSTVSLPYTGNNITMQSGIIDFLNSGNNKFRYWLEGSDGEWKTADRDFVINYSRLAPGDYKLHAATASVNNKWNAERIFIQFSIAEPWWQTWQFKLFVWVFIIGAVIWLLRWYYHRQLQQQRTQFEKQQAVEFERTRIATDMHDDLGAGLSRIKFLSETIDIKQEKSEPIKDEVKKIREYSHDMIDKMGELVWALNEKNDSVNDLLAYTRAYTIEYLTENGIAADVGVPEQADSLFVNGEFRRNIFLTVKEALHNIVKHAHAKNVVVTFTSGSTLLITIKDDGIGFQPENIRPFSDGLANMKKRIESIGGNWQIRDDHGVVIEISVPLA